MTASAGWLSRNLIAWGNKLKASLQKLGCPTSSFRVYDMYLT